MARLVVNPGSPGAWEIQLKPGTNFLGRGFANDFKIDDPSVSGSHCQIVVDQGHVLLKDLGSTNGTYINRAPVHEASLQPGQTIHLGRVELIYDPADAATTTATPPVRAIMPPALPPPPPTAPPVPTHTSAAPQTITGSQNCKFHPKAPGRYLCNKCNRYFCELCVTSRAQRKFCRHCGSECVSVQVQASRPVSKSFYVRVPGAFVYPFRGMGLMILIFASIAFMLLEFMSGGLSIFATIFFYGFLFLFMQNIIHVTASDENEPLCFPNAGDLFGGAFQLAATVVVSFGIPLGLIVARFFEVDVPGAAIVSTALIGCLYFPMAFLAVAMNDSVVAANPLIVIPAIVKMPLEYLLASFLLIFVFGVQQLGNAMALFAGAVTFSTRDMKVLFMALGFKLLWGFVKIYFITVNMRLLGLLYISKKDKFGWFSR
jgi:hypothetical protein